MQSIFHKTASYSMLELSTSDERKNDLSRILVSLKTYNELRSCN